MFIREKAARAMHGSPRRALVLPALALAAMWIFVLALAAFKVREGALLAAGAAGLLLTVAALRAIRGQQAHLHGLAITDPLTGLVNHRGFHEALEDEVERARRAGASLALVALDLDDFKAVNDRHGHPYGDEVLRAVGVRLRACTRPRDAAARVGGEEFALILPGAGAGIAETIAERARKSIEEVEAEGVKLSASAGIAVYPVDAEDASTLWELADSALYAAKQAGKRRTRRFDLHKSARTRSRRQADQVAALLRTSGSIRPVYQPVVALPTGSIVGFEALARFPTSSTRAPEGWFKRAQASGLGPELEAAAIRAALEPIGRPPGTHLALNVSPSALVSEPVQAALPEDLTDLVIEITEHEDFARDGALLEMLVEVRRRGARIAIDDVGAGYAGLKQVMAVRPQIVKLDRELTAAIHTDPARMALVEAWARFARRVGAKVCAEGIETVEDLRVIANLDVEWGQGFALARPADPWAGVSEVAAEVCREALEHALREPAGADAIGAAAGNRQLEHLSARLASARSRPDLERALGLIAAELRADKICLSQWHPDRRVVETLAESGEQPEEEEFPIEDYPITARVLRGREAVQVLAADPRAPSSEVELMLSLGFRSMLLVPVIHRGESLGLVEAYSKVERPWTRAEINSARIISNQFASVIEAFFLSEAPPAVPERRP